ncbi:MAG: hypothetical protein QNL04_03935 [SAR324 cluster bacterium]|nr:hypothetical protein [SAR324 cluster bacterium]
MKRFIITIISCIVPLSIAFAHDFSGLRKDLIKDFGAERLADPKITILFETQGREKLKEGFDLVKIKKNLSEEMLRSFQVTDPVIAAETLKRNNLDFAEVSKGGKAQTAVARHLDSNHILLVELSPEGEQLSLRAELVHPDSGRAAAQVLHLARESKATVAQKAPELQAAQSKPTTQPAGLFSRANSNNMTKNSTSSWVAKFGDNFVPSRFRDDHNESWIDFSPTAFLNSTTQSIEMFLWLKNLTDVEIPAKKFRYDWRVMDNFQLSYDLRTNSEAVHHSSHFYAKLMLVNLETMGLAFGGRKRVTWNSENTEFDQGLETDEINNKRNGGSLFLASTVKIEKIGLLANLYLDNQKVGAGAKFLITDEFKVYVDGYQNYYENAIIDNESVIGIQFYNPDGSVATLRYDVETEQTHLGLSIAF